MYMFFWFFKQFYYCLRRIFKSGLLLLIVFFIAFLFIFIKPTFALNATDIPQVVLEKANQLNHNYNNFIILQDATTNEYYLPYTTTTNTTVQNNNWTFRYFDNSYGAYISPGFVHMSMVVYRNGSFITVNSSTFNSSGYSERIAYNYNNRILNCVYCSTNHYVAYYNYPGHLDYDTYFSPYYRPYITNRNLIANWSFSNLNIYTDNLSIELPEGLLGDYDFYLGLDYNGSYYYVNINSYYTTQNNDGYFIVPSSVASSPIILRTGSTLHFDLVRINSRSNTEEKFSLGTYTLNISDNTANDSNEDSNRQLLTDINNSQQQTTNAINNLNNSQQETTEAIDNLNDTITNSSIDNSSIYLPSDNSNDITSDGLNGIFTSIYNAFCTGQAQDIVFPIPFTNKNITLQANYIRQMLSNSGATWVITIIEAFWWYLISRFIIKDITNKITKIKSGNIEDIEDSNIKGDML